MPRTVVFLTEDTFGSSVGGVEQHIYHVAQELARRGLSITVLSLRAGRRSSKTIREIRTGDVEFHVEEYVRFNPLFLLVTWLERFVRGRAGLLLAFVGKLLPNFHFRLLTRRVAALNPDIVHQHDYVANLLASKLIARSRPVVFTNHTGQYLFLEKFGWTRRLQRRMIAHYRAIIGPSRELTPADPRAVFISNGVDTDFFAGEKQPSDARDRLVAICPRRWAPTKGIRYLAEALTLMSVAERDKILIVFAGSNSNDYPWYSDQVREILRSLPDAKCYALLGNLDQPTLRGWYLRSDVVVIPSLMEATSLAALEGMACGLPVLSTDVGGMPDVVVNPSLGWLVPSGDSLALRDALATIVETRPLVERMGQAAKEFVRAERSWRHIAGEVLAVYERVVRSAAPATVAASDTIAQTPL